VLLFGVAGGWRSPETPPLAQISTARSKKLDECSGKYGAMGRSLRLLAF